MLQAIFRRKSKLHEENLIQLIIDEIYALLRKIKLVKELILHNKENDNLFCKLSD